MSSLASLLETPRYELTLPISKQKITYRPFLVREQRILLQAQEEKDEQNILNTIFALVEACTNNAIKVTELASADFELLMLNLRSKSVGSIMNVEVKCQHCNHMQPLQLTLDDIKVSSKEATNPVDVGGVFVEMQPPSMAIIKSLIARPNHEKLVSLIISSIKSIIKGDIVIEAKDQAETDLLDFVDALDGNQLAKLQEYIDSLPEVILPVTFKCNKCSLETSREIKGLLDFFI